MVKQYNRRRCRENNRQGTVNNKVNPTKSKIKTSFLKRPEIPQNFNTSSTVKVEHKNHAENPNKQKLNKNKNLYKITKKLI